jgi:hypothetical protein
MCVGEAADAFGRRVCKCYRVLETWLNVVISSAKKDMSEVKHRTIAHILTEASRLRPHGVKLGMLLPVKDVGAFAKGTRMTSISHHYLLQLLAPALPMVCEAIFVLY